MEAAALAVRLQQLHEEGLKLEAECDGLKFEAASSSAAAAERAHDEREPSPTPTCDADLAAAPARAPAAAGGGLFAAVGAIAALFLEGRAPRRRDARAIRERHGCELWVYGGGARERCGARP